MMSHTTLRLLATLLLTACGAAEPDAQDENLGATESELANGRVTTDHPAVVLVYAPGAVCTGSFLGANTVLTAAHCLKGAKPEDYFIHLGNSLAGANRPRFDSGLRVKRVLGDASLAQKASLTESDSVRDFAILITEGEPAPAFLGLSSAGLPEGAPLVAVGYGLTEANALDYNKREGTVRVSTPREANTAYRSRLVYTRGSNAETYGKPGDSGGPRLFNGSIVAITSTAGPFGGLNLGINARVTASAFTDLVDRAGKEGGIFGRLALPKPVPQCVPNPAFHNATKPGDVNGDGFLSPVDVLIVINARSRAKVATLPLVGANAAGTLVDVDNDGCLTEADVKRAIDLLRSAQR